MVSIPKVFHTLEKKEMTLDEYEKYIFLNPHRKVLKAIRCVECGDEIIYCKGQKNVHYFKHLPSKKGHYCSLYHEGVESTTIESLMRKKLLNEEGISLNFELKYYKNDWSSLITIPSLTKEEIEKYMKNNSRFVIDQNFFGKMDIPISYECFNEGELKQIRLNDFPKSINIRILGDNTCKNISFSIDGFNPEKQIYSTLISQYYWDKSSQKIDLRKLKTFICKKCGGYIYTKKHYYIFERSYFDFKKYDLKVTQITMKKITLNKNIFQNFIMYDIVFEEISNSAVNFCEDRNCKLVDKVDAIILWPPMNSIGNYKYFKESYKRMFILFENDNLTFEMLSYKTDDLVFKISNKNTNSFYVSKMKNEIKIKENFNFDYIENEIVNLELNFSNYLFCSNVLIEKVKVDEKRVRLGQNEKIIGWNNKMTRKIYIFPESNDYIKNKYINILIQYSRKFVNFNKNEYLLLSDKYIDNLNVKEYLDVSYDHKKIKKELLDFLMEEKQ